MGRFILKRLFYGFLVLFGIILIVFFLFNVLPGDPARQTLGQRADVATVEAVRKDLGLDKPLPIQLLLYLNDLSPISLHKDSKVNKKKYNYTQLFHFGNEVLVLKQPYLRRSYQTQRNVSEILLQALPQTAILAITAIFFATLVGVFFGIISALKHHTIQDNTLIIVAILGIATPSFFASVIISWLFGFVLSNITGLNMYGGLYDYSPFQGQVLELKNLILPALTLGIRPLAIITQLTRSSMLDTLSKDFVRTAKAKGLTKNLIIYKHTLKNALNPVLTAVSGWLASLLSGAFFVEYIFDWKGIGKVTIDALVNSDFPVVMGSVVFISVIFVITNILVDILYAILDPRIRIQ